MERLSEKERLEILKQFDDLSRFNSAIWDGIHPLVDSKDIKQVIDVLESSVPKLVEALDEAYKHIDTIEKPGDRSV